MKTYAPDTDSALSKLSDPTQARCRARRFVFVALISFIYPRNCRRGTFCTTLLSHGDPGGGVRESSIHRTPLSGAELFLVRFSIVF